MDPCYCVRRFVAVALALVVVASAATAAAQYMYLDANGDGVHTEADVFAGSATLDVWLVTDHNRDGSPATCAGDPSAALTINSYSFILRATQGTVAWSDFQDRLLPQAYAAGGDTTSTEFWIGRAGVEALSPGRYRLASLTVTATFGSPSIWIVSMSEAMGGIALTSFGSQCMGADYDNTMKLGTDWFDADGAPFSTAGNAAPVLDPIAPITAPEGSIVERTLHATDSDGQPLTFGMNGPSYASVTTTDPGTGSATGLLRVAPGYTDAGIAEAMVFVSDGTSLSGALLHLTVTDVNRAPVLQAPADMTVAEGKTATQEIRATDADGTTPLSLSIASGPAFMTLSRPVGDMRAIAADLVLRPGYSDEGSYTGAVAASDGMASDTESFAITVTQGNQPPVLPEALPDVSVVPGTLGTFDITATDPEGQPLTFSRYGAQPPAFMTVLTIDPGHGTGIGRVELRPTLADVGDHNGSVMVSDGSESSITYFGIQVVDPTTVDAPPVLNPIADMVAVEGETVYQSIGASDPDENWVSLTPVSFFPFMSLDQVEHNGPETTARIVLAPGPGDRGRVTVGVRASDGVLTDEEQFQITILEPRTGSTMLQLHRGPGPSDEWETLQFRDDEAEFTASVAGDQIAIECIPPQPKPDGTAWGPSVQLACLPAQRPLCLSSPINDWTLRFQPPLGQAFVPGVYAAQPNADNTHAGFQAESRWCWTYAPPVSAVVIRQIARDASGRITSFWANVRHDPDATSGLFTAEVRYEARLPVSIASPSRMEAHAGVPLEVPLRIGGYGTGAPSVTSSDLPAGAVLEIQSDTLALFRWTPSFEDKGLHELRFMAQRPGSEPDTCLMTTCVDIPGELTSMLDVNRLEALVTNRGATADWAGRGAGLIYPRGSTVPVAQLAGLVLGGVVDGSIRVDLPTECCDYHAGPIQNGAAAPFEPRFKNYTIRRDGTSDFDWIHWPSDLGAPTDANGSPELSGDQTIWSLYNDAVAPWDPAPYARTPLEVEVRQTTWGLASPYAFGDAAYQSFRIRNSGLSAIQDLYAALFLNPVTYETGGGDVAFPQRGLMGTDTTSWLAYAYGSGIARPNAVGVMLVNPPRPASIQERRWSNRQQVYATLQGLNPDGTPRHERDDPSLPLTPYAYTGDPLLRTGWIYPDQGYYSAAELVLSAGPFDLAPGEEQEVTIALIAASGIDRWDAVRRLRERAANLRTLPPPPPNQAPIADAGGPYSGFAGAPIQFDGSASRDPDGDALTYTWRFGDGTVGSGLQPLHTYSAAGNYSVRLLAFDTHLGVEDTTTAQVAPVDSAAALLTASGPAVRLQSARPAIWISLEPSTTTFTASDIDVASVTLERADGLGSAIAAVPEKSPGTSDADHDGIAEIAVTFRTAAMRTMLADLPPGSNDVAFWIRGSLSGGGRFAAPLHLTIDAGKRGLSVSVAPNPLNPTASLMFRTAKPGPARVVLFDVSGRVVRVAFDERSTPAGYHEVPIGRDDRGHDLPSGVYFYRVLTPEGSAAGKLVMMK